MQNNTRTKGMENTQNTQESQTELRNRPTLPDIEEIPLYEHVKRTAGWWNASAMSKVVVKGTDRLDLVHRLTTNDVRELQTGQGEQTVLLTDKARVIDVLTVLARPDDILLLFSPGMQSRVLSWFDKYTIMDDFRPTDISATTGALIVTGPQSPHILAEITGEQVVVLPQFHWKAAVIGGVEVTIVRYLTICEFSYIILYPADRHGDIAAELQPYAASMPEINTTIFDVLHIESGHGAQGAEWTEDYNPLEAGLVRIVNFKKGCYIGQEVVARLDSYNKVKQHLVGFISDELVPPGAEFSDATRPTGKITRSTFSPELQKYISLGYIRTQYANPGTTATAHYNGRDYAVEIVKLPFTM